MMKQSILFVVIALFGIANALCPGETPCSGHGTCGTNDKCTCYDKWNNVDCSDRVCPFKKAWADIKDSTISGREPHYYAECSGKGVCDVATGECTCFEGFTGSGCDRMTCPDDCSGHGTCEKLSHVNSGYTGWDAEKIQVCQCDAGWQGSSCSLRTCAKGDDPITAYTSSGAVKVSETQDIQFSIPSAATCGAGNFALQFTDMYGQSWTTHAIDVPTITAYAIKQALEAIPNAAIPAVSVTLVSGDITTNCNALFRVEFGNAANTGSFDTLGVVSTTCTTAGCQPVIDGFAGSSGAAVTRNTAGTKDAATCANRGRCNFETGVCQCADGYSGQACDIQTIIT